MECNKHQLCLQCSTTLYKDVIVRRCHTLDHREQPCILLCAQATKEAKQVVWWQVLTKPRTTLGDW